MDTFENLFDSVNNAAADTYNCGDNVVMYIYRDITEADFFEQEKKLEDTGYVVFQRHDIAGNIHFTLKKLPERGVFIMLLFNSYL